MQIVETDKIKCNDQSYWKSLVAELIGESYDLYCNKTINIFGGKMVHGGNLGRKRYNMWC